MTKHNLYLLSLKNSELLQELEQRIKTKRIRFTRRIDGQCIGGLLSWNEENKYYLNLTDLDEDFSCYSETHWHSLETKPEEEKSFLNCTKCNIPIKLQPSKRGFKVLEFYGKWTGKGHALVCQKCLEKKQTK